MQVDFSWESHLNRGESDVGSQREGGGRGEGQKRSQGKRTFPKWHFARHTNRQMLKRNEQGVVSEKTVESWVRSQLDQCTMLEPYFVCLKIGLNPP